MPDTLLSINKLCKTFPVKSSLGRKLVATAVDGVTLTVARGEAVGLIGESGCGKSTLGRLALRLLEPTAGTVRFDGVDLAALSPGALAALRPRMQIIFQDPYASLNPRRNVEQIVGLPLALHTRLPPRERRERVVEALDWIGLGAEHLHRYPHQFSGGQRQRIGIARALVTHPALVVCDEPVSALDVSIQAQVLALLKRLRREFGLAYLFISHDIAVVAHLSERIAVMYLGRIVESGTTRDIVIATHHHYTQALLSAVPHATRSTRARIRLSGDPPSPIDAPSGCAFHQRCSFVIETSTTERPVLAPAATGHAVACHLAATN